MNDGSSENVAPWRKLLPLLVVAAGILAYANSFRGVLLYDDEKTLGREISQRVLPAHRYFGASSRPLAEFTFALNASLGGKTADYHALNLAIHLAAALLLFGIVRRTARAIGWGAAADGVACAAAGIWVAHPLTTSAVTFVSQRYESLMGLFYLLTLYAVIRGSEEGGRRAWYGAAVVANGLGLMCKEVMVTAPVAVWVYDWVFLARGSWRDIVRKRGFLYGGLAAGWGVLAALVAAHARNPDRTPPYVWQGGTPADYIATQGAVVWHYLRLAVWPADLCLDYRWLPDEWRIHLVAALALAGVVAVVLWGLVRRRSWSVPAALFFVVLAPTSLVPRFDCAAEYRMYLPLAALVCLAVTGAHAGLSRLGRAMPGAAARGRVAGITVACAVAACMIALTVQQNALYGSQEAMWTQVARIRPGNPRARLNLACALLAQGDNRGAADRCGEALRMLPDFSKFEESTLPTRQSGGRSDLYWDAQLYAHAHNFLGVAYGQMGRKEEAAARFREALRVVPGFPAARKNLAVATGDENKKTPP